MITDRLQLQNIIKKNEYNKIKSDRNVFAGRKL